MSNETSITGLFINSHYQRLAEENNLLILKNQITDNILRISNVEFEILEQYAKSQSITETYNFLVAKQLSIEFNQLISLIEKAKELKLLINKEDFDKIVLKENVKNQQHSTIAMIALQILGFVKSTAKLLGLNKLGIRFEFTGGWRFYKLFSIDVSNSIFSRFFERKIANIFYAIVLFAIGYSVFNLINAKQFDIFTTSSFGGVVITQVSINKFVIFFIILFCILFTSFIHEISHYFIYKQLKGKTNEFGFALMNYCIPVVYVSTNTIYLWTEKWKKIAVSSAGILIDSTMMLLIYSLLASHSLAAYPNFAFICFIVLLYLIFRTVINANFLIPGTDGYFIFVDIFNLKNFYQTAFKNTKSLFTNIIRADFKYIKFKSIVHSVYYLLSLVIVISASLLLVLSLLYPLISDWIIRIFLI